MLCFRRDAQGGRSAFRLRIAPDDCVGVPTVILPCGVMAIICLGHPRSCGVAAGVPCTGSWLFKEFLAGSPVAMGGMKGVRCHAHALCYFLYFACVNPCACRGGAEALPMGLRREGCLPSAFSCPAPQTWENSRLRTPGVSLGAVAYVGTYVGLPCGGAITLARCLRAGRSRSWRARVALRRLAPSLPRAARVDVLLGMVARVAVGPSWRCGAVSSFAASRGSLGYHW